MLTASTYWQYTWHRVDTIFTVLGWVFVAVPALDKFLAPLVILRAFRLTSFLALAKKSATSTFKSVALWLLSGSCSLFPRRLGSRCYCCARMSTQSTRPSFPSARNSE